MRKQGFLSLHLPGVETISILSQLAEPHAVGAQYMKKANMDDLQDEYDFSKARRGAVVPVHPGKTRITIRLDDDILTWFREQAHAAGGGNYQTLLNDALRAYIQ